MQAMQLFFITSDWIATTNFFIPSFYVDKSYNEKEKKTVINHIHAPFHEVQMLEIVKGCQRYVLYNTFIVNCRLRLPLQIA